MAAYNFKKHVKVYIVFGGLQYRIDVSDISFSQTFTENSYDVKTLHEPDQMFEGSTINKANPANYNFSLPLIQESDYDILFDLILSYDSDVAYSKNIKSFDLYIQTQESVFKLETCAFANANFVAERNDVVGLELSGEASKLTRAGAFGNFVIPGTPQTYTTNPTYLAFRDLVLEIDSIDINSSILSLTIELQNNIEWVGYTTVNEAITATDTDSSMYPIEFILQKRILAGSIGRYLIDNNVADVQEWQQDIPLHIFIGDGDQGLDFDTSAVSLTNRLNTGSVFVQNYDWRMTESPSDLNSVVTFSSLVTYLVFAAGVTTSANISISTTNITDDTLIQTASNQQSAARTTAGVTAGKFYYEFKATMGSSSNVFDVGVVKSTMPLNARIGNGVSDYGAALSNGRLYNSATFTNPSNTSPLVSSGVESIIMVALDMDNLKFWIGVDGTWWGSGGVGNPTTGTNTLANLTAGTYYPAVSVFSNTDKFIFNNNTIPFTYTPPVGFSSGVFI